MTVILNAAELDQRLTLQAPAVVKDAAGQPIETFVAQATVWGKAMPLGGRELMAAQAVQSDATVRFRIRFRASVLNTWRVLWKGRAYAIESEPIDVRGQRIALDLLCKLVQP